MLRRFAGAQIYSCGYGFLFTPIQYSSSMWRSRSTSGSYPNILEVNQRRWFAVQEVRNGTSTWHSLATTLPFFLSLYIYTHTSIYSWTRRSTYVDALNRSLQNETLAPGHHHPERQKHDNDQRRKKMLAHWIGISTLRIFRTFTPNTQGRRFYLLPFSCCALLLPCSPTLAQHCWLALWTKSLKGLSFNPRRGCFQFSHTRSSCTGNCPPRTLLYMRFTENILPTLWSTTCPVTDKRATRETLFHTAVRDNEPLLKFQDSSTKLGNKITLWLYPGGWLSCANRLKAAEQLNAYCLSVRSRASNHKSHGRGSSNGMEG